MAEVDIKGLVKEDAQGDFTEVTESNPGGILPVLDGSKLTGVYGNTYIASTAPTAAEDGFGSSLVFLLNKFEVGRDDSKNG